MENIKGSAIIGNKIEFAGAEIDDRTYNWHSAFLFALPGVFFCDRSVSVFSFSQFLYLDPYRGEGLQPGSYWSRT